MMALIFDHEIVNSPIQMINKNNVLLYVFRMAKDCFAKFNAANVKLLLISGTYIIKILTLIIIINNFSLLFNVSMHKNMLHASW